MVHQIHVILALCEKNPTVIVRFPLKASAKVSAKKQTMLWTNPISLFKNDLPLTSALSQVCTSRCSAKTKMRMRVWQVVDNNYGWWQCSPWTSVIYFKEISIRERVISSFSLIAPNLVTTSLYETVTPVLPVNTRRNYFRNVIMDSHIA